MSKDKKGKELSLKSSQEKSKMRTTYTVQALYEVPKSSHRFKPIDDLTRQESLEIARRLIHGAEKAYNDALGFAVYKGLISEAVAFLCLENLAPIKPPLEVPLPRPRPELIHNDDEPTQ